MEWYALLILIPLLWKGKWLWKLLLRSTFGLFFLTLFQPLGQSLGISLGVNLLNAVVLGCLGGSGFGLILLLQWFLM